MDAVELPLPAKVDFGKILTAAEGVDGGAGGVAGRREVLRRCADVGRRHGDLKQHNPNGESCRSYRSKKTSSEVSVQKSLPLGFKSESTGQQDYLGADTVLSLPRQDVKMSTKKTIKLLSGPPCSKRPKLEPTQNSGDAGAKDHEIVPQKMVPDQMQFTSPEKSRLLKEKRIFDAKRSDKKSARAGFRSKHDCFASKAGSTNFDSGFLGNSIVGSHGLKSDIRDVTNHMEDLSLSELLNGTYKHFSVGREKGKRVLRTKDELLVSIRKACSMLDDMDSSTGKDAAFILNTNLPSATTSSCTDKYQCSDKPSSLIKDPAQTGFCSTTLCHPRDILHRLAFSPGQDLNSLLLSASKSSAVFQPAMHSTTFCGASLPPFLWLHSHAGGYRPSADSGKFGSSRSNTQWQWVRVGCNLTSEYNKDLSIDDLIQEMDMTKASFRDPSEQFNLYCTGPTSGSLDINSGNCGGEHCPQQLNLLEHGDSSDGFQKHNSKGSLPKTPRASPKACSAAEILCEMARSSGTWITQGYSIGTIKRPKSPSDKAMKARKPSSPFGTAESSSGSQHSDATRSGNNQSTKKVVDRESGFKRMNNPGKGPARWPVPTEGGTSPSKSERGQTHSNVVRHSSQAPPQARLEKEYEHQQKLRKATLTSSFGFAGVSPGDWNRDRNKRL